MQRPAKPFTPVRFRLQPPFVILEFEMVEPKKHNYISINGNITILESFQESDISDEYISWLNDKKIVRYSNQRFIHHNLKTSKNFLDSFKNSPNYFFKISDKKTLQPIGTTTLYVNPNHGTADIGILIGDIDYWNGGYGSDAWNSLIRWAFCHLSIRKITAGTLSSNIGMQKVMEKSGMTLEGRKIRQEIVEGIEEDILYYSKFKS
jgi:ribosomal-protein-alanine N-acetyltransferase